jgi:probable HAF family extracellular repeat protein
MAWLVSTRIRRRRVAVAAALCLASLSTASFAVILAESSAGTPVGRMTAVGAGSNAPKASGSLNGGLLLDRGVFRRLPDVPNALSTVHQRNNNRGQIVGTYAVGESETPRFRGFLMDKGRITRIDVPGAVLTVPTGINDHSQVVGSWFGPDATQDPETGEFSPGHAFRWERGRMTKFDVPGATETAAYEINNLGQIVGYFYDANDVQHAYVMRAGAVTVIDHPRATDKPGLTGTRGIGLDDRGRIVGGYGDDAGTVRAFRWERGRFTTIHPPGALLSEASEIDNRGRIVGRYVDSTPKLRSFLLDAGRLRRIDVPGRCDTAAFGLNDRGQILIAAAGATEGTTCPQPTREAP